MEITRALLTTVTPQEIQHVLPAIIALTKKESNMGKNVGKMIADELIPELVRAKLTLAQKHLAGDVSQDELQQEIIASINRVITKSPYIQLKEKN